MAFLHSPCFLTYVAVLAVILVAGPRLLRKIRSKFNLETWVESPSFCRWLAFLWPCLVFGAIFVGAVGLTVLLGSGFPPAADTCPAEDAAGVGEGEPGAPDNVTIN